MGLTEALEDPVSYLRSQSKFSSFNCVLRFFFKLCSQPEGLCGLYWKPTATFPWGLGFPVIQRAQALMPRSCAVLGTLWTGSADRRVAWSGRRGTRGTLRQMSTQKSQETEGLQSDITTPRWDWDLRSWRKKYKVSMRKGEEWKDLTPSRLSGRDLGYTEKWPL